MLDKHLGNCHSWAVPLGRVLLSLLFIVSGIGKALNFETTVGFMESVGVPFAALALVLALILEIGGALSLLLGYKVKWGACALIVFTILTTAFFHIDFADQVQQSLFFKNLAIIGGLLYVLSVGAGTWSLDGKRQAQVEDMPQPGVV